MKAALLEHPLLRAPYESVHKITRNTQKIVAKEMSTVMSEFRKLSHAAEEKSKGANLINGAKSLSSLVKRLQGLKRKMEESQKTSNKYIERCRARLGHLQDITQSARRRGGFAPRARDRPSLDETVRDPAIVQSLDRMVAGHLLREGCIEPALELADECSIGALVDAELHRTASKVIKGFRARDCGPALSWCRANRSRLRRIGSSLETDLRVQCAVGALKVGRVHDAIAELRRHIAPCAQNHMKELLHVMGAAAYFPARAAPSRDDGDEADTVPGLPDRYLYLFRAERWTRLESQFKSTLFRLSGLHGRSMLSLRLQAGLEAMKTPLCRPAAAKRSPALAAPDTKTAPFSRSGSSRRSGKAQAGSNASDHGGNLDCPVCAPGTHGLAVSLAASHRTRSCLVCRLTGKVMSEDNPPVALPNGNVYSKLGLMSIAAQNKGKIVDPQTGQMFAPSQMRSVYIL